MCSTYNVATADKQYDKPADLLGFRLHLVLCVYELSVNTIHCAVHWYIRIRKKKKNPTFVIRIFWYILWGIFRGVITLTRKETKRTEEDNIKFPVYTKQIYMAISRKMPVKFNTFTKIYKEQSTNFQFYRSLQVMVMRLSQENWGEMRSA